MASGSFYKNVDVHLRDEVLYFVADVGLRDTMEFEMEPFENLFEIIFDSEEKLTKFMFNNEVLEEL